MRDPQASKQDEARRGSPTRTSGWAGLVDWFRGIPDRLRRPESLLMLMAMLASLGAHMPPWVGLGALADYFHELDEEKKKHPPLPPAEVTFEVTQNDKPKPPEPEQPKPEQPKPEQNVSQLELPPPEAPERRKQSITQKSDDPNVEPPPDAKYLAEENRRVEEETVARVTDEHRDDPDPTPSAPQAAGPEESGDSLEDQKGQDKGQEKSEDDKKMASVEKGQRPEPPQPAPPPEATATPTPARPAKPAAPEVAPTPANPAPTVVHDPLGSFVLAPAAPARAPQKGQGAQAAIMGAVGRQPNIKVSWSAFESTFGAEQLAQDRLPRAAKRRGAGREKRWSEFRAAIENYVVGAKPGNTTALNAAADPFAAYLAAFHRNLHDEFAHEFLASLPALGDLSDTSLVTLVEIVVNPDGTLDRVGVVKSSGNLMYDFGAFNAVERGAPYPVPPEKIRSPDGRVYMRWALHRDESQCGTWNAEPFILKNPPRSPNDPQQDNVSPYRPGGPSNDAEHGRAPQPEPARGAPSPSVKVGETTG